VAIQLGALEFRLATIEGAGITLDDQLRVAVFHLAADRAELSMR
jgi:hypothetical protein